ncbi:hypothetical protein ACFCVY_07480 [Streptomyces sp. NPDC056411]
MPTRDWHVAFGIASALAGVVLIVSPFASIAALTLVVGPMAIVLGLTEVVIALMMRVELGCLAPAPAAPCSTVAPPALTAGAVSAGEQRIAARPDGQTPPRPVPTPHGRGGPRSERAATVEQ